MANYTGTITVKIQPKLLDYTSLSDFVDITSRVIFSEGGDSSFTFTQSSDGSQSSATFSIFTMFPLSVTKWSAYTGATDLLKATAALADPTFDFEVPARAEVQIYESGSLIYGGIITEVARERTGGSITTRVTCQDYTALLDEVVIDRYKAPYDVKDYQIIKGGYATDKEKNGISVVKLVDGGSGSTREITISCEDAHDLLVGQKLTIDRSTNYNGDWTVSSILSEVSVKATKSGTAPYTAANETSGRLTPWTASIFSDIRTTDAYSGNAFSLGINYNSSAVEESLNDVRFSPISYLPDASYPEKLGAKLYLPFSDYKVSDKRFTLDPVAADLTNDLRCIALTSAINERNLLSSVSSYDTTSNYIDITTLGTHNIISGEYVAITNPKLDAGKTSFTKNFRASRQSSSVIRMESASDPAIDVKKFAITGAVGDGTYITYTCVNSFIPGDLVGIGGITETSTAGYGSLNIVSSVVEEATPTAFKIKNPGTQTATNFTGAYAYTTYIQLTGDRVQNLFADSRSYKILAADRQGGVSQIWYDSTTPQYAANEVVIIEGLSDFDGRVVVSETSGTSPDAYTGTPFRVYEYGRYKNVGVIGVAANKSPYVPGWKKGNRVSSGHPFIVGAQIVIAGLTGSAATVNGTFTITKVVGNRVYFTSSGSNTGSSTTYIKSLTSKSARLASSVAYTSGGVSWIKFSDTRVDTDATPDQMRRGAIRQFNFAWPAISGGRSAGTPSASFITAPEDTLAYIGGRQGVKFTSSAYQGLSSRITADISAVEITDPSITFVTISSNVVTIQTDVNHKLVEGQQVVVAATTKTAVNGTFTVESIPSPTTFTYSLTAANYAKTADTGSVSYVSSGNSLVTITTRSPHRFREGQMVVVQAATKTAINGGYQILATPTATTYTFGLNIAAYANTSDSGPTWVSDTGFAAMSKSFSAIIMVQPSSFPSSGSYKTIWHHGSIATSQRRELMLDSTGQIVFSTVHGTYYNTGLTLTADVPAIIYVSLDSSTGTNNLVVSKNDETVYTTSATNYSGTTDTLGAPRANLNVGYGWTNASVATRFYDGLIGDFIIIDRVLTSTERSQLISWMAHSFTLAGSLLSTTSAYKLLSDNPGRDEVSKVKEPFNGMTLRQAMDYISKKAGTQYWVDSGKNLHYVKREVKNLVENPTFEDRFGNASLTDWTFDAGFTVANRTDGPYGYGYAASAASASELIARSKFFPVTADEVYFASAMIKTSDKAKTRLKMRFYDSSGVEVSTSEKTVGSGVSTNDSWEKMWGLVKVPGTAGITQAALIFHHTSHSHTYTDYYANPKVVKITGEFGFADYGIAPGSSVEMLFDTTLNAILPLKTFESPSNISQHGSSANRVHIYAKPLATNATGDLISANVVTGQVLKYTFDYIQGVWNTHGKIIESSTINKDIETAEDAALAADAIFSDSGKTIESYEFDHPTAASDGRLTVGSVVPYFWSEVGVVEPMVVKSQTTKFVGGEAYYSVQLAGEPALERNAIVLVQREQLTVNLGPGQLALTRPTRVKNIVVNSLDVDGKQTTFDLKAVLNWTFDSTDPRNKLVKRFEIERRDQELQKTVVSHKQLAKSPVGGKIVYSVVRGSAAVGAQSNCYIKFAQQTHLSADDIITISGWKNPAKVNFAANPDLNGSWVVDHVSSDGKIVYFNMFASATSAISGYRATKAQIASSSPKFMVSWYETVKSGITGTKWGALNPEAVPAGARTYTDDKSDYQHRYQYRIRAVAETADGGKLYGDWAYVPSTAISSLTDTAWLYISRSLSLSSDGGFSDNAVTLETTT